MKVFISNNYLFLEHTATVHVRGCSRTHCVNLLDEIPGVTQTTRLWYLWTFGPGGKVRSWTFIPGIFLGLWSLELNRFLDFLSPENIPRKCVTVRPQNTGTSGGSFTFPHSLLFYSAVGKIPYSGFPDLGAQNMLSYNSCYHYTIIHTIVIHGNCFKPWMRIG